MSDRLAFVLGFLTVYAVAMTGLTSCTTAPPPEAIEEVSSAMSLCVSLASQHGHEISCGDICVYIGHPKLQEACHLSVMRSVRMQEFIYPTGDIL